MERTPPWTFRKPDGTLRKPVGRGCAWTAELSGNFAEAGSVWVLRLECAGNDVCPHLGAPMRTTRSPLFRRTSLIAGAGVAVLVSAHQFGCSNGPAEQGGPGASSPGAGESDTTGTVGMSLTLLGGEVLNTVSWTITGPNGAATVVRQGSVNLQGSNAIAFQVAGIASGSNYAIALSGVSVDGTVTCSGSATFSVTAGMTTNVTVLLQCNSKGADAGSAAINGQTFACASAGGVSASPSEATLGNSVSLTATATGPNPGVITYAWSAPSGTFSAPTGASTNFTCTMPGPVTVTLTVADGPVPAGGSCDPSSATSTVQVQCDTALDAGTSPDATVDASGPTACNLGAGGAIKHLIYVQFDNTHLARDPVRDGTTNVPSDLEQMPHLLSFIRSNGTMMANDHTVLISHTAGGILSSLTGMYPDRIGQIVTNSYVRTSTSGAFTFPSSFQYWTNQVSSAGTPTVPNLVQPDGSQVPAPWVSYTRAGCNFGAIAAADMELENTGTGATGDITNVFGTNSPQWNEAKANSAKAATDFEGVAVHCAQGSSVCATGEADVLANEPGGYSGFLGLFGTQQINPFLTGQDAGVALTDLLGNPITDTSGNPGFPGFGTISAAQSLAYIAAMQEHGIPITYAYISDAHDNHATGNAFGPGQAGYVAQLQAYDQAFANFFTRLASDGINQSNTLFVFTVDEGDHFVGAAPSPTGCDGVTTPCTYPAPAGQTSGIGEVQVNIDSLVTAEQPALGSMFVMGNHANPGAPYDFTVHGDDAPAFYLSRVGADAGTTGPLAQTDPVARQFERAAAAFTLVNPYTGNTDSLLFKMADQTGMKAVHMFTTGDPVRNPTFTYYANDDYFITDFPTSTCADCIGPGFAWNHGDDQSIIGQTWLGFVGPGVKNENNGGDQITFTDHTDVRPTILSVLGLHDTYMSDGRVITQALLPSGYSSNLAGNVTTVETLGDNYKQINAPFGPFAQCALTAATAALQADDATYTSIESSIANLTTQRDTLATSIKTALDAAEFGATPIDTTTANGWIASAQQLLSSCQALDDSIEASPPDGGATSDAGGGTTPDTGGGTTTPDAGGTSGGATSDVVVYRVGDGTAALSSAGTAVFLDQYSAAGALEKSTPMPTTTSGSNHRLVASGTATSEGLITRSVNGHLIVATGYDAAPGTATVVSTTSAATARVVGLLNASGGIDTTTGITDSFSGNNIRSGTTVDGTQLWLSGANTGVVTAALGASMSAAISATTANLRQIDIFGSPSQLYVGTGSGSNFRIGSVGTGLPTTTGQVTTGLPGLAVSGGSPYAFFMADLDGSPGVDTMYVADDSVGLTKYSLVSGSWVATGTIGTGSDTYRGVTGVVSGTTVTLYTVRLGSELDTLVDASGYSGTLSGAPTTLATAGANTAFRGVALAPQ
jgi:hypothetical protein